MARKTPVVRETKLYFFDEHLFRDVFVLDISRQKKRWQDWLNGDEKSFRFEGRDGTRCTVVKEVRASYGRKGRKDKDGKDIPDKLITVWYAHRRLNNKLRRKYIGKSENVTHEKLRSVAFELSQRELNT